MDDLEQKIGQILSDPDSMSQIFSVAKSLGVMQPEQNAPQTEAPPLDALLSADELGPIMEIVRKAGNSDHREAALLNALKPYCSSQRQKRIDRAVRIARLSQLAGAALRSLEKKE